MAFSRGARILTLLVIDVIFFLVELVVGYTIGSLALVADSFHMLNDIISLVVAFYAIKLSKRQASGQYSYAWHRAEILAAFFNGVFLLALCFSIFLEAIQRFFSNPTISQPMLIVIVGSLGLASNIVGLLLFHEHGHSHGEDAEHQHSHSHHLSAMEAMDSASTNRPRAGSIPSSMYGYPPATRALVVQQAHELAERTRRNSGGSNPMSSLPAVHDSADDLSLDAVQETDLGEPKKHAESSGADHGRRSPASHRHAGARHAHSGNHVHGHHDHDHAHDHDHSESSDTEANKHDHAAFVKLKKGKKDSHGHSHAGGMNMRALVLHVIGDGLGNIGVIASGLIIWLTHSAGRFYCDPAISIVITMIIFSSAMPLVRSASFILLQAVPQDISLDDVRDAVLCVPGVLAVHELHVWQLSESKIVASVHARISPTKDYMDVAIAIRKAFHDHGIHSCTIQPEFHCKTQCDDCITTVDDTSCLISCGEGETCVENACCPPVYLEPVHEH